MHCVFKLLQIHDLLCAYFLSAGVLNSHNPESFATV